jgi:hypothetical protein
VAVVFEVDSLGVADAFGSLSGLDESVLSAADAVVARKNIKGVNRARRKK